ncbi:MAG TPA: PTS sugar transporter subunit IIA [bacterium]|nr:PTS sugar transporter subunit IIA [bacterium]HPN31477.1 PTS sugar transporter subunit IIA [bacterium]
MNIIDILQKENIELNLKSDTKEGVIIELLNLLKKNGAVDNIEGLQAEILKREQVMSTGIGKGIGLPHCKSKSSDNMILAVGRHKKGIVDYDSLDDEPVKLIFLLISPEDKPNDHINMLARISRIVKLDYIRNSLVTAGSSKKFFETVKNEDKKFL